MSETTTRRSRPRRTRAPLLPLAFAATLVCASGAAAQDTTAKSGPAAAGAGATDPRVGLRTGWMDAGEAARNMELVAHRPRPEGFYNPQSMGDFGYANADLAFRGNLVFQGGFNGFQVWDVSNPRNPTLRTTFVCPGGQGDLSVYRNLLFMSVEETRGRVDCGAQGVTDSVSADRFRGVRIFDITDIDHPKQIAAVQTCRGSHTHTLVRDPKDTANVYIYVSGTAPSRPAAELAGCVGDAPLDNPNNPYFRIEVIRVPLAAPQEARIVNAPRIFSDSSGNIAGLWKGGSHGEGTQATAQTNQCHDVTVYTALGLAAGACAGNGILLDIADRENPVVTEQVRDTTNFAFWHSATFNNDGTKVLFTDEWGGGVAPRCRATDRPEWGADAIFTLADGKLTEAGYYKLPAPQTAQENCVAHNGSLIPVPGRDIMAQAWYQGGVSVFDFTDAAHPKEIAFFDRGPMDTTLVLGGYWSAYWYNGHIYGSEIGRGLDIFELKPSELLSQNEIDAAKLVRVELLNPQDQQKIEWPASFVVARAYLDQLARNDGLARERRARITRELDAAEKLRGARQRAALSRLAAQVERDARGAPDAARVRMLAEAVRKLATARS
ncbi:MAG TPA: hypothetical protein VFS05_14950 [Gemmatimonadaceae bacterium]|nr:hypothetical protein [Gemmatimonadaceae bacterium]